MNKTPRAVLQAVLVTALLLGVTCGASAQAKDVNAPDAQGKTALMRAAEAGDLARVQALTAAHADVNQKIAHSGLTALMLAASCGHVECVNALIAAHVDVNQKERGLTGRAALMLAAENGHVDCVNALIAAHADVNQTPGSGDFTALMAAAGNGHVDCVNTLIAAGTDVNAKSLFGQTALIHASDLNPASMMFTAIIQGKSAADLDKATIAARARAAACVKRLIAARAEVNARDNDSATALMCAARNGSIESVHALIAAGADVNAKTRHGDTALMRAVVGPNPRMLSQKTDPTSSISGSSNDSLGSLECVKALIAAGADVNAKHDNGWTALMGAAKNGSLNCVNMLVAARAEVNARTRDGHTALMDARNPECVEALIAAGADVNAKTTMGWTALMGAVRRFKLESVNALIAAGADVNAMTRDGHTALQFAKSVPSPRSSANLMRSPDAYLNVMNAACIVKILQAAGATQ